MAESRINNVVFTDVHGRTEVFAHFGDGSTRSVFSYFADEISFRADELIGLTEAEARELHHQRDREYLQHD